MESGEIVVNSWLHVLHLMLNLQEGHNELESVRDTVSLHYYVCFNSTTFKITTFVKGVW